MAQSVRARADCGFTLLEVLVALTILVLVLGGISQRLGLAAGAVSDAEREEAATEAAQGFFAELGQSRPLAYGVAEGDFPAGQHWRSVIAPLRDRAPLAQAGLPEGHQVTLTISWLQHGRTVRLVFETLRLGAEQ